MASIYNYFKATSIALTALGIYLSPSSSQIFPSGFVSAAYASDIRFTVEDVKIDVTADSAASARDQAFAKAEVDAFTLLAQRILPPAEFARFKAPSASYISRMVQDMEVTQERLSRVRYIASFTVRFKENEIRRYFNNNIPPLAVMIERGGISATNKEASSDTSSSNSDTAASSAGDNESVIALDTIPSTTSVVILPFYQWGARLLLWDDNNSWMGAWAQHNKEAIPVMRTLIPIGDAQDITDIADNEALTYKKEQMAALLARYSAPLAYVTIATPIWSKAVNNVTESDIPSELSIMLYRTSPRGPQFITTVKTKSLDGDTIDKLYSRAIEDVQHAIQKDWDHNDVASTLEAQKFDNQSHNAQGNVETYPIDSVSPSDLNATEASHVMQARVRIRAMSDWVKMQRVLNNIAGLDSVRVMRLSPQEARISLNFRGNEERLKMALSQARVNVTSSNTDNSAQGAEPLYDLSLIP
jgi:hypothetical protein